MSDYPETVTCCGVVLTKVVNERVFYRNENCEENPFSIAITGNLGDGKKKPQWVGSYTAGRSMFGGEGTMDLADTLEDIILVTEKSFGRHARREVSRWDFMRKVLGCADAD